MITDCNTQKNVKVELAQEEAGNHMQLQKMIYITI